MLFNSFVFLQFALVFFLGWRFAKGSTNARYLYLIVFSFAFYAYDTPWWLLLLIGTGGLDFLAGIAILDRPQYKKLWLALSLSGNLGLLFFFKYSAFFATNVNGLLGAAGMDPIFNAYQLALPIGISFYTFQSMSYTITAYRGGLTPTRNPLQFFAYVSLWPQLVAGPIERASELLPQLAHPREVSNDDRWEAVGLIVRGYFKKMVIADNLAPAVNTLFASPDVPTSTPLWWVASIMFAMQIYGDFSGYTDIARGFAKWMGFSFMLNFDHPYGARSIREFWQKWHISLSTWFRDYVYIPLGGSKGSKWAGLRNMWITMLVSGIWHGAAWTFVIWGALHAAYLTLERLTSWPERLGKTAFGRHASAIIVFGLVVIAWVFFRAASVEQAISIVRAMLVPDFNLQPVREIGVPALFWLGLALLMVLSSYGEWGRRILSRWPGAIRWQPAGLALLVVACVFWRGPGGAFIYFQF